MSLRRWLLPLAVASLTLTSCLPPQLMGESRPPGYAEASLPSNYVGQSPPFSLTDPQAIAAGESLYRNNCATCHGDRGVGDGPMAPYLEPRPANFASPAMLDAFRRRPDYLFWRVSDGVSQTGMPSWKDQLNDTQRWQVIAYAGSLGERARGTASSAGSGIGTGYGSVKR